MVLRGKLRGRVGRRRINFYRKARSVCKDSERAFVFSPTLERMMREAFGLGLGKEGRENVTHATPLRATSAYVIPQRLQRRRREL